MITQKYTNELTHTIIGAAIEVHRELGPGLLESIHENCMAHLLLGKGILINFNCTNIFRESQKAIVNELYAQLPPDL